MSRPKAPTTPINIRFPDLLLAEMDEALASGDVPYSDRTDLITGSVRKELDACRIRKTGTQIVFSLDAPEPR